MRINRIDLENALRRLTQISKQKYRIDGAYGGWQLVYKIGNTTAINQVTYGFKPARELYDIIWAIIKYIEVENKDYLDLIEKNRLSKTAKETLAYHTGQVKKRNRGYGSEFGQDTRGT